MNSRRRLSQIVFCSIAILFLFWFLQWLNFQLWQYDDAVPLKVTVSNLGHPAEPFERRSLNAELELLTYSFNEPKLKLTVAHRPFENKARPILFLVQSGNWRSDEPEKLSWYQQGWAEAGYTVATLNHRSRPDATFDAMLGDVLAGMKFVLEHADELGADPSRVALFGGSSGAHLALLAAYIAEDYLAVDVRAAVNIFGPTDFRFVVDDWFGGSWYRVVTIAVTPEIQASKDVNDVLGCNIINRNCRDRVVQASPITYISNNTPATLSIHGRNDKTVPWNQAIRLSSALKDAGVEQKTFIDESMQHHLNPKYLEHITDFLDSHLY